MNHDKLLIDFGDFSFQFLTFQLSFLGYWLTLSGTGQRERELDSGEGA